LTNLCHTEHSKYPLTWRRLRHWCMALVHGIANSPDVNECVYSPTAHTLITAYKIDRGQNYTEKTTYN